MKKEKEREKMVETGPVEALAEAPTIPGKKNRLGPRASRRKGLRRGEWIAGSKPPAGICGEKRFTCTLPEKKPGFQRHSTTHITGARRNSLGRGPVRSCGGQKKTYFS